MQLSLVAKSVVSAIQRHILRSPFKLVVDSPTPMECVEAVPQRKQHFERQGNEPCLIIWLRRSGLACETSHLLGSTQPGSFFHNESRRLRSRLRLEVFSRNEEPDFWHTPASRSFMQSAVSECSISQFFQAALHGAQITAGINF